jgi:hypothetical protein
VLALAGREAVRTRPPRDVEAALVERQSSI